MLFLEIVNPILPLVTKGSLPPPTHFESISLLPNWEFFYLLEEQILSQTNLPNLRRQLLAESPTTTIQACLDQYSALIEEGVLTDLLAYFCLLRLSPDQASLLNNPTQFGIEKKKWIDDCMIGYFSSYFQNPVYQSHHVSFCRDKVR
ncbi:MAG: hypothetical protein GF381_01210 [Candidatus Pacebacteria bacterium]|nr:hypothetical protein [Candidatus Paceibacterota bacterium]